MTPKEIEMETLSTAFEEKTPQEIITWAVETFCPDIAMSSSFQTQSVPLLYMVSQIEPNMRILFANTGFHFWDTLMFREHLERVWNLNIIDLRAEDSWRVFLRRFGRDLYTQDPDLCCFVHKVQPIQGALGGVKAWITGIRRDQTAHRSKATILEPQKDGLLKINPMLNWTKRDVWRYIQEYGLPEHPLLAKGYTSIGCVPCTRPVLPGEDARSGRWQGMGKTECGLHTEMFEQKGRSSVEVMAAFTRGSNS
ncbi:MAG: phosphoadenylyl-sulfate reductase [Chloroflexi bacterium]|nr:phosphoadenylyl-sulfate reductase [Chloroflexota bacterium]